MMGAGVCREANFGYTYSDNLSRESMNFSSRIKELKPTYNGYINKTMMGITFLYNSVTGNTGMSREQLNNLDRLYYIRKFEKGWNGYDSETISETVIEICETIIRNICVQPIMFPTGRCSIQLQYELEDKSYLELEIFEKKIICMEVPQRVYEKARFEVFTDINMDRINQIVRKFYAEQNR